MSRAHVVTISDRASAKKMQDESGPALVHILGEAQFEVTGPQVVPDDVRRIADAIVDAVALGADIVVTTGGTGAAGFIGARGLDGAGVGEGGIVGAGIGAPSGFGARGSVAITVVTAIEPASTTTVRAIVAICLIFIMPRERAPSTNDYIIGDHNLGGPAYRKWREQI